MAHSTNPVTFRLAKPEDKVAVLNILDEVYEGIDYLATLYDIMIQDKNCYCGVVEDSGKIVAFLNVRVFGNSHVNYEAGRIDPKYEGKRVITTFASYLTALAEQDGHNKLKREAWVSESGLYNENRIRKGVLSATNSMMFGTFKTSRKQLNNHIGDINNDVITLKDCNQITDEVLAKLFEGEYFVAFENYRSVDLTLKAVRDTSTVCTTFVSRSNDRMQGIDGLSFSSCSLVNSGIAYVCYMYTRDTDVTIKHINRHIAHASTVCPESSNVRFIISVPGHVDGSKVMKHVEDRVGPWVPSDMPREHIQVFYRPFIKSKI